MYSIKDLKDPYSLLEKRNLRIENRILTLDEDYSHVNHFFSKAIIETELDKLVDDYIERSFILQRSKEE
jgi:hypothetical protein